MPTPSRLPLPQPLGPTKTFGFGDCLGFATLGHLAAARKFSFAPVFAQQAIRQIEITGRALPDVLASAQHSLAATAYVGRWGADASGLRTEADALRAVAAGFTHLTLDPTSLIEERAGELGPRELETAAAAMVNEGILPPDWTAQFLEQDFDLHSDGEGAILRFDQTTLLRAGVKFAHALHHGQRIARAIASHLHPTRCELEFSLADGRAPTTPLEHLFCAIELRRRSFRLGSLAPRFRAPLERGIDFEGDVAAFESELRLHVAIARRFGPYTISFHRGSDKFALYPVIGRICGELLHIKTSGTTYFEALRVVCRTAPELFREIASYSRVRFANSTGIDGISTTPQDADALFRSSAGLRAEGGFFDTRTGRQLLAATQDAVLGAGRTSRGRRFKDAIAEVLASRTDLFREQLDGHFTRHLMLLNAG